MPIQKSSIMITGTINGMTFYEMNGKFYVRSARKVSKQRIAKHASYARFRENGNEFGGVTKAGKLLRQAVASGLKNLADNTAALRLTSLLFKIKNLDAVSSRGKRNMATALEQVAVLALLRGFEFNIKSPVSVSRQPKLGFLGS